MRRCAASALPWRAIGVGDAAVRDGLGVRRKLDAAVSRRVSAPGHAVDIVHAGGGMVMPLLASPGAKRLTS